MKRHGFRFLKTGHIPAKVNATEQKKLGGRNAETRYKSGSRR